MRPSAHTKRAPGSTSEQPADPGSPVRLAGVSRLAAVVCGTIAVAALVMLCGVMTADVIARYVLTRPLSWSGEVVKFLMSIIFFSALPIASIRSDHIVVDVLSRRFVGRMKTVFASLASLASAALMALFAWYGFDFAIRLMKFGDRTFSLGLPLHYAAWAAAAAFAVAAVAFLVHALSALGRGR